MTRLNIRPTMEGNILFNVALNTFYLRLYGVGRIRKDHLDNGSGFPLSRYLSGPLPHV